MPYFFVFLQILMHVGLASQTALRMQTVLIWLETLTVSVQLAILEMDSLAVLVSELFRLSPYIHMCGHTFLE